MVWLASICAACSSDNTSIPIAPAPDATVRDVASTDMGADSRPTVRDMPAPVDFDDVGLPTVELPADFAVGEFVVHADRSGLVDVHHTSEPERSIFASAPFGNLIRFARTTLTVEEHQGSFETHVEVENECARPEIETAYYDGSVLVLEGGIDQTVACSDLTWRLRFEQPQPGHLSFVLSSDDPTYNRATLRVASEDDERIVGMGEQFRQNTLDLKGKTIPVLSQEGGVGRGHTPISQAINAASPGSAGSEDSTYYAAPHFITSNLRSLFLENTEYAEFAFERNGASSLHVYSPQMRGRVLYGDSPLALIERFTEWAGRMPALPDWVHEGAVVALATDMDESRQRISALRAAGVEIAAVWNQTWSGKVETFIGEQVLWNWVRSETQHPGWSQFVADMGDDGIRVLCYINPMLVDPPPDAGAVSRNLYEEAIAGEYFVKNAAGDVYTLPVTAFDVGLIDLTNPDAVQWMKSVVATELLQNGGCSGWMADFAEALPFDAVLHSGVAAATYHNQYPVDWIALHREVLEENNVLGDVLVFNRSGFATSPRHAMLLWQGDQLTTWDKYDGLVSALHGIINGGFSGIALNHSDTGGYTSLSLQGIVGYEREREQLKRWTEMNAFTTLLRTHEGNQPSVNAQVYTDSDTMQHFARFTKVYKALAFYRRTLVQEAATRGWPVVRHLWMQYPEDAFAMQVDDQFMLGSELLIAPIKNKCFIGTCEYNKELYLPAGEWVHLWSGDVYGDVAQGMQVTVQAPLGEPTVFYRRGSAVGAQFVSNLNAAGIAAADPP